MDREDPLMGSVTNARTFRTKEVTSCTAKYIAAKYFRDQEIDDEDGELAHAAMLAFERETPARGVIADAVEAIEEIARSEGVARA
jgi:hypothetical protein